MNRPRVSITEAVKLMDQGIVKKIYFESVNKNNSVKVEYHEKGNKND